MYSFDWTGDFRALVRRASSGAAWRRVAPNVWLLGLTSLLTDISSEMVASVLPLYLVLGLGMSPFLFGVIDGLYPGVTALVRWVAGALGDRTARHKELAVVGYAASAASRLAWLVIGVNTPLIAGTVTADRIGKGIRTAPRDALISLSAAPADLGGAFGVHRAMDAAGAMVGPLVAFALLAVATGRFDLVFVVSFAFALVGLAVLVLFVRNPPAGARTGPAASLASQTAALARHRQVWPAVIAGTALAAVTISDAFIYLYLALQYRGVIAPSMVPLLFVGTSFVYLLLAFPAGLLADRVPRWKVFLAGHLCLALLYLVLLMPSLGRAGVAATLILLGAYYASTDGVLPAMASAALPRELRGSGLGLLATATSLARLVASVAFGWLWSQWGTTEAVTAFATALPIVLAACGWALARWEREIIRP
ncbi:MAG: MFS transporter [Vicinamibacterales bacterium]